jgi:hypothetical protein
MSGPAQTSLPEPKFDTCDISPTHNDCRKAGRGGSPAQGQRPRRSTDRWACERCQLYRALHRTAIRRVCRTSSSTIQFYGRFGPEAAFPSRWRAPGLIGGGLRGVRTRAIWGARLFPRTWSRTQYRPAHRTRCQGAGRRADFFPRPLQIFDQNELWVLFLRMFN